MIPKQLKSNAPQIFSDSDIQSIRQDFPILKRQVNGKPLVYLDNAATAQKPLSVIQTVHTFYENENANIHRSIHRLGEDATQRFEESRERIKCFINADSSQEIVFVRGATEGINLVANSYGHANFQAGDEVILTQMEHHANIVPWQILRDRIGIQLKIVPLLPNGDLDMAVYPTLFNDKTKFAAVIHTSNALGTVNPVKALIDIAHQHNVPILLDSTQAVIHDKIDVQALDCDFMVFSGHKLYGPTGIGVLYGKQQHLDAMPPYQGGGEMIEHVSFAKTTYQILPYKFEAGTPHIAGAIGLAAAIEYLQQHDMDKIIAYEQALLDYATQALSKIDGLRIIGQAEHKAPIITFIMQDIHALDLTTLIDQYGIAIRSGHHCAIPTLEFYQLPATCRMSLAFYNTRAEVDFLVASLLKIKESLRAL